MRFEDAEHPASSGVPTTLGTMRDALGGLIDNIASIERLKTALEANQAELIEQARQWAEVIEVTSGVPDSSGWSAEVRSRRVVVTEIATALRIPERTAENLVAESRELVHDLPATFDALANGSISRRHASKLIDHARSLPSGGLAQFEEVVLPHAERLTVAQFDRKARQVRERTHPESIDIRHRKAFDGRAVSIEHGRDGMSGLFVPMPAAKAQGIYNRLTDMAQALRRFESERDGVDVDGRLGAGSNGAGLDSAASNSAASSGAAPRTLDQLRADLLVELLLNGHLIPEDGKEHPDLSSIRATVLITVPVLTLLGHSDEPASLEGYGPIDYDTALELAACAPSFIRILTHPETGTVLSVGRERYRPPSDLRTWLRVSDVTCRFPGCSRSARICELDHTCDWQFGGETAYDNLAHLCCAHHNLKHHTGWTVEQLPGRVLRWTSPTGHVYLTEPDLPIAGFTGRPANDGRCV